MSDQKRWFKLWHSALSDDELMALGPALRWAWAALGAHVKVHGTNGRAEINTANAVLAAQIGVPVSGLLAVIKVLPHLHVEEGKDDNGRITVTFKNWHKFQEDSTGYERVKRLRSKRRGEERRERGEKEEIPPSPHFANPFQERRTELAAQDLEGFLNRWRSMPGNERHSRKTEFIMGLKRFRLGFKIEDQFYLEIIGGSSNEHKNGESIFSQIARHNAKKATQSPRPPERSGAGGLRSVPEIQDLSRSITGNGAQLDGEGALEVGNGDGDETRPGAPRIEPG